MRASRAPVPAAHGCKRCRAPAESVLGHCWITIPSLCPIGPKHRFDSTSQQFVRLFVSSDHSHGAAGDRRNESMRTRAWSCYQRAAPRVRSQSFISSERRCSDAASQTSERCFVQLRVISRRGLRRDRLFGQQRSAAEHTAGHCGYGRSDDRAEYDDHDEPDAGDDCDCGFSGTHRIARSNTRHRVARYGRRRIDADRSR